MTKDTEKAFKILYCEYLTRRKKGFAKFNAVEFESGSIERLDSFKEWYSPDIDYALRELNAAGYIRTDILGDVTLTESGIEFMEAKPREFFANLSELFNLVALFV